MTNFLPYIKCKIGKMKNCIKILIDSGANINLINPGIMTKTTTLSKPVKIDNAAGQHVITTKGTLRFDNFDTPPLDFYEHKFSNQFQGVIGTPTLASYNARIDYESGTLTLNGIKHKFKKHYPPSMERRHLMTIETVTNGDWVVPEFQKLTKSVYIEPGLYRARDNKTTVSVACKNCKSHSKPPKLHLTVNNFERLTPLAVEDKKDISKDTIKQLIGTQHLSPMEREALLDTMLEHKNVLLTQGEKLTSSSVTKHKIITIDEKPVFSKTYRCPHQFKPSIEEQIQEMLNNGIIRHSQSPYSAPIWVVPKKADASGKKKVRIVIDYRKLNEKTIDDKYPIPRMEEVLDLALKSQYFTTLDLKSGFHQISMDEKSIEKTAFSTDKGHFEFTRMP